jgi:hypothetical protein
LSFGGDVHSDCSLNIIIPGKILRVISLYASTVISFAAQKEVDTKGFALVRRVTGHQKVSLLCGHCQDVCPPQGGDLWILIEARGTL